MPRINIINKETIARRLKTYLRLGLVGLISYTGVWAMPRVLNQWDLKSNKQILSNFIQDKNYAQALEKLNEISKKEFIIPETAKRERDNFIKDIKYEKIQEFERLFTANDYTEAVNLIDKFKQENYFSSEEIKKLEGEVQNIHPKVLEELADNIIKPRDKQLRLYLDVEREFNDLGQKSEGLSDKIIKTYIRSIEEQYQLYDNWKKGENTSRELNDLGEKKEGVADETIKNYLRQIKADYEWRSNKWKKGKMQRGMFINYLKSNPIKISIENKRINEFLIKSNEFMDNLLKEELSPYGIRYYLDQMNELTERLGIENKEERIKALAMKPVNYFINEVKNKPDKEGANVDLENIVKLNKDYSLNKEDELMDLYLMIYDKTKKDRAKSKKVLDTILLHSESLPEKNKNNLKVKIAERYIQMAQQAGKEDAYSLFQVVKGLYHDLKVPRNDKRFLELDGYIKSKIEEGVNLGVENPPKFPANYRGGSIGW